MNLIVCCSLVWVVVVLLLFSSVLLSEKCSNVLLCGLLYWVCNVVMWLGGFMVVGVLDRCGLVWLVLVVVGWFVCYLVLVLVRL